MDAYLFWALVPPCNVYTKMGMNFCPHIACYHCRCCSSFPGVINSLSHFKLLSFLCILFSNFEYYMDNCAHCFMVCFQMLLHVSIFDAGYRFQWVTNSFSHLSHWIRTWKHWPHTFISTYSLQSIKQQSKGFNHHSFWF